MTDESRYTISQLAELAGVTPRTIRYYTAEGLLLRPEARGQYALYSGDHLLRLHLIARLKAAYLPLGEIKARIEQLDAEQIRALLAEDQTAPEPSAPTSATEYLAEILTRQPAAPGHQQLAERPESYSLPAAPAFSAQRPVESAPAHPLSYGIAAPATPEQGPQQGLWRRLLRERRQPEHSSAPADVPPESWQRITLAPGVELHVREPLTARIQARVDDLIAWARSAFDGT